ncbi:winged helix-turn-helix domain-containing protein [Streptomyces sp. NPDC002573]|uniref:winged helix-turn-helix domain-containing protein n=1 Tax=Streptomyces sp. NPDC002573 TaxID=3364651 RepID=UPI0036912947
MNEAAREVNRGGESLHLTPNGFGPLRFLMPNPGRVHTAAEILEHVWSYESVIKPASSSCTVTTCGRKSTPPASHSSCQVPATCCGRNGHERGRNLPEVHKHPRHTVGCAPWQQAQEPRIPRRLSFASPGDDAALPFHPYDGFQSTTHALDLRAERDQAQRCGNRCRTAGVGAG